MFVSWKKKLFCLTGLFSPTCVQTELWIENHWWNVRISSFWKKNKSRYFGLQTLKAWNWDVQPLKCYSVKVFGVHRSNVPRLSALKQFLICLEKAHKRSFTSHRISSKRPKRYWSFMQTFTVPFYVNEKTFPLRSHTLFFVGEIFV